MSTELFCPNLKLFKKGKVREVYDLDDKLLIVATDNLSAFDVVLPDTIPGKGKILTQISNFWFKKFADVVENHLLETNVKQFPDQCLPYAEKIDGRSVLVKKTELIEVEAIVRGYLSGSGFKEYKTNGSVCGTPLPEGLKNSAKLEKPIFTPSTKAVEGHDINVSKSELLKSFDSQLIEEIEDVSLKLYLAAADFALERGIIIADTKFEFGILDGKLILIDEILTPDSSRFWPADGYQPGKNQDSYDKQIVRDYLNGLDWDKTYPGPHIPQEVIGKTIQRYEEVYNILKQ